MARQGFKARLQALQVELRGYGVKDVRTSTARAPAATVSETDGERRTVFAGGGFGFPPEARLVLFPEAEGARLAWEVRVGEPSLFTSYVILVDARDGTLLYRENTTLYAEARRLDAGWPDPPTEEFAPAAYLPAPIPASTPQSPAGWITGAGTALAGNNASSHLGHRTLAGLAEPSRVVGEEGAVDQIGGAHAAPDRLRIDPGPGEPLALLGVAHGASSRTARPEERSRIVARRRAQRSCIVSHVNTRPAGKFPRT